MADEKKKATKRSHHKKAERKPINVKVLGTQTRVLAVKLSPEELADRADRLAQVQGKLQSHVNETKEIGKQRAAVKEQLENELRELGQTVRSKQEYRPVDCRVEARFATGRAFTVRDDTGEEIESRALTLDEKQGALFSDEPAEPPPRGKPSDKPPEEPPSKVVSFAERSQPPEQD